MLSASSLSGYMKASLPRTEESQIRNPYDAIALLSHACMLATGFRLVGLSEDHKIATSSELGNTQPLPKEWNETQRSDYAFRYAHSQSSLEFLVKVSRLGGKAVINGLGIGDDKVASCDVVVKDYISESSLPYSTATQSPNLEDTSSLQAIFISPGRITDFASLMKINVVSKLAPGLNKEGYESTSTEERRGPNREPQQPRHNPLHDDPTPRPALPHPMADPLAMPPRRPFPEGEIVPPGFEDPHGMFQPPGRGGIGGRRPMNIGERDLYPQGLGPNDPFRGSGVGPLGGFGGGGMHPTFDDPLFGGQGRGRGQGGFGNAPPGARYDPLGPGDGPQYGRGGRPPNPFGGFGDNDFI